LWCAIAAASLVPAGAVGSIRDLTIIHRFYPKSIIALIARAANKTQLLTPQ
jgi:hypothetical protein